MKRLSMVALVVFTLILGHPSARAASLTGTIIGPDGNFFTGSLVLRLNYPAQKNSGPADCGGVTTAQVVTPRPVTFAVFNGSMPSGACVLGNDVLNPQNTVYIADFYDNYQNLVEEAAYFVAGSTFNIGAAAPSPITTNNVNFLNMTLSNLTVSGTFTGGVSTVTSLNLQQKCDQFPGSTAGRKLLACIQAAAANGGWADATGFTGAVTFDVDPFQGVTNGVRVLFGTLTASTSAIWIIPSNSDVGGLGASTLIGFISPPSWAPSTAYATGQQINGTSGGQPVIEEQQNPACVSGGGSQPTWNLSETPKVDGTCSWITVDQTNFRFINDGPHPTYYPTAGGLAGVGINLHDMTIDGGSTANFSCIGFRGAAQSNVYNLFVQNCTGGTANGFDLRDVQAFSVHDNIILSSGSGAGHALGGGTNAAIAACAFCGRFRENKFYANHVSGGTGDGLDISGINGTGAVCDNNDVYGNTIDGAGSQAIFNETCGHTSISHNIVRNSGKAGIYLNTGVGGQNSNGVTVSSNTILAPGHDSLMNGGGIVCVNSSQNTIVGNTIEAAQDHGINLLNCGYDAVAGNKINGVGLNANSTYSGIYVNSTASGNAIQNSISGNSINGGATAMLYGISYVSSNPGNSNNNVSSTNVVNGGSNGNAGGVATTPVNCDGNSHNNYTNFDQYSTSGNAVSVPTVQHCT